MAKKASKKKTAKKTAKKTTKKKTAKKAVAKTSERREVGQPELSGGMILWTCNRLAYEFDVDRRTIRRRLISANVVPTGTRRNSPVYKLKDAAPAILRGMIIYAKDAKADDLPPDQRSKHYDAELKKVELEKRSGELIPVEDYREDLAKVLKSLIQFIDTLPELLARDCGLDAAMIEYLQKTCDEKRESLYASLINE